VLAIANYSLGAAVFIQSANRWIRLGPQEDVRFCAVSPDGRWVATGSHGARHGPGAMVWDASTGQLVRELPVSAFCRVSFSPNGKWLLTTGGGARLWSVGDWSEGPALGSPLPLGGVFSTDGSQLALADAPGVIRLVVPTSGKEVVRLTAPEPTALFPCCFTADGTRLLCLDTDKEMLQIFDLRLIRRQLAEMNLDWEAPPFPQEQPIEERGKQVAVELVGAEMLMTAVELNNEAWRLVTNTTIQRDPERALKLVQLALKQQPGNAHFLNTLGVIHYRRQQYGEAITVLEKSQAGSKEQLDVANLFFLAMCHSRLGATDKARDCFQQAVKWMKGKKDLSLQRTLELQAFRSEAETVLSQE
jgi:hypothetical protein